MGFVLISITFSQSTVNNFITSILARFANFEMSGNFKFKFCVSVGSSTSAVDGELSPAMLLASTELKLLPYAKFYIEI